MLLGRGGARGLWALALVLWGAALLRAALAAWVAGTVLPPLALPLSAEMVDRNGVLLRAFPVEGGRWRLDVAPEAVDPFYLQLLIATEDKRFWTHEGVDGAALIRAGGQALREGRIVSGGSTLTMQVARLLEGSGTGRWAGKLRQMRLALALEQRLSKQEILGLYLRLAPFGGNLEGVRAASLSYFGKEPARLTPAEAALLVALPQAPEARRPDRAPGAAGVARDRILVRAADAGLLTAEEARAAARESVPSARRAFPRLAPHVTEALHRATPHQLRIVTTLEAPLQARAEDLARRALAGKPARLQVALLFADHRTGEVRAAVGAADFTDTDRRGFVDMTAAPRSPGSLLKPLIYALAFDQGLAHPQTLIEDRPLRFGAYAPENFDHAYLGTLTMAEALRLSRNLPAVAVTEALGPAQLLAALTRAGANPQLPAGEVPGLALALGGLGLSLRDLVQLYAALAEGGIPRPLRFQPEAEGAALPPEGPPVVGRVAAWQVGAILAGMIPPPGAPEGRLAYKTGTSYGHRDAWAIGYDGAYVGGVWLGRADGTAVPGQFGAESAAPLLFELFGRLAPEAVPLPPPPPEALILPTAALPLPLQRFTPRGAAARAADGPHIAFPPEGAVLALRPEGLPAKAEGGTPPYMWLLDGKPFSAQGQGQVLLPLKTPGFVTLSVIDAAGQGARVHLRLQ